MEINGEQVNGTKTYAELGLSEAIMRAITAEMTNLFIITTSLRYFLFWAKAHKTISPPVVRPAVLIFAFLPAIPPSLLFLSHAIYSIDM